MSIHYACHQTHATLTFNGFIVKGVIISATWPLLALRNACNRLTIKRSMSLQAADLPAASPL